jgi:hypothetical protein
MGTIGHTVTVLAARANGCDVIVRGHEYQPHAVRGPVGGASAKTLPSLARAASSRPPCSGGNSPWTQWVA